MTTNPNESSLARKKCVPCEGGAKSLTGEEAGRMLKGVPGWRISPDSKSINIEYMMKNFMAAVKLINEIARIAESENHHPDLHLVSYRKMQIILTTHAIGGLSENDFILAAKINTLPKDLKA